MKKRSYVFVVIALIVVSILGWVNCEKESNDAILSQKDEVLDFEVPTEVASYFTATQIDDFYKEAEKEVAVLPPAYEFLPVMIEMENDVLNIKSGDFITGIQFDGKGNWERKEIKFYEKVTFIMEKSIPPKIVGTEGEGNIFMKRTTTPDKTVSREDLLNFESKDRVKISGNPDNALVQEQTVKYTSKITFFDGYGMFDGAHGSATKVEIHRVDEPGTCRAAILGYVFIKKEAPGNPDS